jgi:predicted ABC-type ATPase
MAVEETRTTRFRRRSDRGCRARSGPREPLDPPAVGPLGEVGHAGIHALDDGSTAHRTGLAGEVPLAALEDQERAVANAELDVNIAGAAARTSYADQLAREGVTTVVIDRRWPLRRTPARRDDHRSVSRLDLVVGPNGSGKSTFVRLTLAGQRPGVGFVNAASSQPSAGLTPTRPCVRAAEASDMARRVREQLLADRREFIAETVASHPSKVDLVAQAAQAGYYVAIHVVLVPEDLAVQRVARRFQAGGHGVPEDKIRARHQRLWTHVAAMVPSLMPSSSTTTPATDPGRLPRSSAASSPALLGGPTGRPTRSSASLADRLPTPGAADLACVMTGRRRHFFGDDRRRAWPSPTRLLSGRHGDHASDGGGRRWVG